MNQAPAFAALFFEHMHLIRFFLLVGLLTTYPGFEARAQWLTPEDAAGSNTALYPRNLNQLQWTATPQEYTWVADNVLLRGKVSSKVHDTLLTLKALNKHLVKRGIDSLRRFPQLQWVAPGRAIYRTGQHYYLLDTKTLSTSLLTTLPEEAENPEIHLPSLQIAYTQANNVFVFDGQHHRQVTNEPEGVECGKTVHRNEFGIHKGLFWSPDGSRLAFYRMDERMVSEYPLADVSQRIAAYKPIRYPMAGMTSHQVTIGIYTLRNTTTHYLQTGEPSDQYLTALTWHPDGKSIFTGVLNRDQNHLKMNHYDATSGAYMATLFEEKADTWVEPLTPLYFLPDNSGRFVWPSLRDGYNHLYLYQSDGQLIRQLTTGPWMVTRVVGFDSKASRVYFLATLPNPLEQNLYAVRIKDNQISRLSVEGGQHWAMLSVDGEHLIDSWSNLTTPRKIVLLNASDKSIKTLHEADNPLKNLQLAPIELLTLKAEDSTVLYARLIKPLNLEPQKKYPVVVYVYGGPHVQLVTNSWLGGANFYLLYLAQQGYVVFTIDNRGSANRGRAFEHAIHRRLGQVELQDQMTGIQFLKTLPFVDPDRIGVDGWSYGGFMSINMILNHPETFKVATAGGPVTDWKYYEVMYGERYMDRPDENQDGYSASSLLNQAGKLEGKLLVLHGDMDDVVVLQHSLTLMRRFVETMKFADFFIYTSHPHNVRGRDRAHLIRKIVGYFDQNLK